MLDDGRLHLMATRQALLLEPVLTATLYEDDILPLLLIFLDRVFHSRGENPISTKTIFFPFLHTHVHTTVVENIRKAELVKR